jgi:hypothetical protein
LGSGGRDGGCQQCHVEGGVLETQVPVTKEQYVEVTGFGTLALPVYKWKYYNIHRLIHLGLTTKNEDVVAGTADIDIAGDENYVRESAQEIVVNYFQPSTCEDDEEVDANPVVCFLPADSEAALEGTGLDEDDLTWEAEECEEGEDDCDLPEWMPVLEPVTSPAPNYAVLGYGKDEVIWDADDPRINPGDEEDLPVIEEAEWSGASDKPKARRGELEVEGSAAPGARVVILNGVTDEQLFSVRANRSDGGFEAERRLPVKRAPCTVKAQVDDLVGVAVPVENAPANCVGRP